MSTAKKTAGNSPAQTRSKIPEPNAKFMPLSRPSPTSSRTGVFSCPTDAVVFDVTHHCMNPLIREGQQVFAVPHDGCDLLAGTPVIVASHSLGLLCKLWQGVSGGKIVLGFLNGEDGQPGEMPLPLTDITRVWKILGVWYGDVLPNTDKTPRNGQRENAAVMPLVPHPCKPPRNVAAASAKSSGQAEPTEFDKVKDRIIFTKTGKPIGYFADAPGIKQLVWLVKQLLRLPVEGIEIENRGRKDRYLAFMENTSIRGLTDEQLGAIKAFRWYCDEFTIGPRRNERHVLSVDLLFPESDANVRTPMLFATRNKAEKCCGTINDVFGFNAVARSFSDRGLSGWVVWIDSHANGNRTICANDLLRLEGVCMMMAYQAAKAAKPSSKAAKSSGKGRPKTKAVA